MSEPKHSNVLLGKSIREIRLRRGLTQREVSEAIGGISESALRSYELGERRPRANRRVHTLAESSRMVSWP